MKTTSRLLKRLGRTHGFSLAEVMVAAGMLGIVSLGLMKMTETSTRQQRKIREDFTVNNLMYEASAVTKSAQACENTIPSGTNLTGIRSPSVSPGANVDISANGIQDASGNLIIQNATQYGTGTGGQFLVTGINITRVNQTVTTLGATPKPYTLTVTVSFSRTANAKSVGANTFARSISVTVVDNDEDGIINYGNGDSCQSESIAVSVVCESLGGVVTQVGGTDRCANIDLINDTAVSADPAPGISYYHGVTSRGGLMITEDAATHDATPAYYWSITPDNANPSILRFSLDDDNNPGANAAGTQATLLQFGSTDTGTTTTFETFADTHTFAIGDGTATMTLDSSGNVGIGTTAPVSTSEVASPTTVFHVQSVTATGDVEVARFEGGSDADNTAAVVRINHANDRGLYLKGGRRSGDSSFAELGIIDTDGSLTASSIAFDDAGNVGMGTDTPSAKLDVVGAIEANSINLLNGGSAAAPVITMNSLSNTGFYAGANTVGITNAGTSSVLIDASGNVGIGTETPSGRLDIVGGHAYLYRTFNEIGVPSDNDCAGAGDDDCKVVNKAWVYKTLAGELSTNMTAAQRKEIVDHILNTTVGTDWASLKADVLASISIAYDSVGTGYGSPGGANYCPAGQFIDRIKYASGAFTFSCGSAATVNCATKENCANVYAGSGAAGKLCVRDGGGTWTCLSSGQITYISSCAWVGGTWTGSYYWATCSGNQMVHDVRTWSSGYNEILCCNNNILGAE